MKYKFGEEVRVCDEFYSGTTGYIADYEFDGFNTPEQHHRYKIGFLFYQDIITYKGFWENEIVNLYNI